MISYSFRTGKGEDGDLVSPRFISSYSHGARSGITLKTSLKSDIGVCGNGGNSTEFHELR